MAIPQIIQELASKVRHAMYGVEVRESIAKGMEITGDTADKAYQITQNLLDGSFDQGELNTNIEQRLNDLEKEYAPKLTQLDSELNDISINIKSFGAVGDMLTDDTQALIDAFSYMKSIGGGKLLFPKGVYKYNQYILVEGIPNLTVITDADATLIDGGKTVLMSDGVTTGTIPVGIRFENCPKLQCIGFTFDNNNSRIGKIHESALSERVPQLDFVNCEGLRYENNKIKGWVGLQSGISVSDAQSAYELMSDYYCRFYKCKNTKFIDNGILIEQTGDGEIFGFDQCDYSLLDDEYYFASLGNRNASIWSLAKVVVCNNTTVKRIKCSSHMSTSFIDVIGKNITLEDIQIDYPNGKLFDISAEWGELGSNIENITIRNCSTTGYGVFNSANKDGFVPTIENIKVDDLSISIPDTFVMDENGVLRDLTTRFWGISYTYTKNITAGNLYFKNVRDVLYHYIDNPVNDFEKVVSINGITIEADRVVSDGIISLDAYGRLEISGLYFDGKGINTLQFLDRLAVFRGIDVNKSPTKVIIRDSVIQNCPVKIGANVEFINCDFFNVKFNEEGSRTKPEVTFNDSNIVLISNSSSITRDGNIFNLITCPKIVFNNTNIKGETYNDNARALFFAFRDNNDEVIINGGEINLLRRTGETTTSKYTIQSLDITTDLYRFTSRNTKFSENLRVLYLSSYGSRPGNYVKISFTDCEFFSNEALQFTGNVDGLTFYLIRNTISKGLTENDNLNGVTKRSAAFFKLVNDNNTEI